MTITLGSVPDAGLLTQAAVLAVVGVLITIGVYGVVALIVKADDFGLTLARLSSSSPAAMLSRVVGRGLVQGMPYFLKALGAVGTAAMIWVGGGIVLHGFEEYGYGSLSHLLHDAGEAAAHAVPAIGSFVSWLVQAIGSGIAGIALGMVAIPTMSYGVSPVWRQLKPRFRTSF